MCRAWHTSGNVHHIFGRNINRFQHRTWTFGNLNSILSENRYRIHDLQKLIHVREMPTWLGPVVCTHFVHRYTVDVSASAGDHTRQTGWKEAYFHSGGRCNFGYVIKVEEESTKKIVRKGMKEKTILVLRCEENSVQKSAASAENLSAILRTVTYFRRG